MGGPSIGLPNRTLNDSTVFHGTNAREMSGRFGPGSESNRLLDAPSGGKTFNRGATLHANKNRTLAEVPKHNRRSSHMQRGKEVDDDSLSESNQRRRKQSPPTFGTLHNGSKKNSTPE